MTQNNTEHRAHPAKTFRKDIQGLRAIAVLLVVVYHAGAAVPAGFLGVDVFFVVSGYVITLVLLREHSRSGRISWRGFFIRRVKRLGPALALMLAIVGLMSLFLLSPNGYQQNAAITAIGASLISANAVIFSISGGYFDQPAETNPLLNTWSLSVEEQFYLLFPMIWILAALWARRSTRFRERVMTLVAFGSIVSFGLMLAWHGGLYFPGADFLLGFYGPLSRAWEFGAGILVALAGNRILDSLGIKLANLMGLVGIVLIFSSSLLLTSDVLWPSVWTLLPVIGTVLVIMGGHRQAGPVSGFLSSRLMVWLGDRSYSVYLWHWPFIVFATLLFPTVSWAPWAAVAVSMIPSVLSFSLVEEPLRRQTLVSLTHQATLISAVVITPVVVASGVYWVATNVLEPRLTSGAIEPFYDGDLGREGYRDKLDSYYACSEEFLDIIAVDPRLTCHQSVPDQAVEFAIVGDSHALRLFLGFATFSEGANVGYFSHGGLPPTRSASPLMADIIDYVAAHPQIDTVVLSSWWNLYPDLEEEALIDTVRLLTDSGKSVFLFDDGPDFPFDAFRCKYGVGGIIRMAPVCEVPSDVNLAKREHYLPKLTAVVDAVSDVTPVTIWPLLCDEEVCSMVRGNQILYQDSHHLNENGSVFVVEQVLAQHSELRELLR